MAKKPTKASAAASPEFSPADVAGAAPVELRNSLPSDAHKAAIDDLLDEAKNWLDGSLISTEAEAAGVEQLLELAREAEKAADASRVEEKRPHDEAGKAVQARYKPLLDTTALIISTCRKALTPWREQQAELKRIEAERAQRLADDHAKKAAAALEAAGSDIGARRIAADAVDDAKKLVRGANKQASTADKGVGLRTTWRAELGDLKQVIGHYYRTHPGALADVCQTLADADARNPDARAKGVPGVTFREIKAAL